ncbi:MAG: patatin [Bacteroidetes bacterium 4572_77]|nr:MAG: patatin [Bacteroidetes bacterium 4572_77]
MKTKQKIALVLSGGGSKGLAHIGVIQELEKQGFEISSVAGTSIGSVIGGLFAMDKLAEYTEWVRTLNQKSIWGLLDFTLSTNGLLKGEKVLSKMKTFIPDMAMEEMKIPFVAVATDILNEKDVVFRQGSYYEAIRASVAIPTIFTPVKYKDTILVDGGVLSPIPIEYVERKANDILVVVNLYGEKKSRIPTIKMNKAESKNAISSALSALVDNFYKLMSSGDKKSMGYLSLLNTTSSAMVHKIAQQNMEKHQPDIVISIPHDSAGTFDFQKADELIEIGKEAASLAIEDYLKLKTEKKD